MPNEYLSRENHPYKYGYGKLFHSGYHFIDLLTWILEINNLTRNKHINNAEMFCSTFNPIDALNAINNNDYKNIFNTDKFEKAFENYETNLENYGELDFHSIINFKNNNRIITNCSLNLMQSGFSRRSWCDLPKDIYQNVLYFLHYYLKVYLYLIFHKLDNYVFVYSLKALLLYLIFHV